MVDVPDAFEPGLAGFDVPTRSRIQTLWADYCLAAGLDRSAAEAVAARLPSLPRVWAASDFVARVSIAHPALVEDLVASGDLFRTYASQDLAVRLDTLVSETADEASLKSALRRVRRREMLRIAWRDLAGWAELDEVMAELSAFAGACLEAALSRLFAWSAVRHGHPLAPDGSAASLVVLGMGKLGGEELNFSSDIDLVFAYTSDGGTSGGESLSNGEFFEQLGRRLIGVLGDTTAEGIVFRVDMRLRPFGASGPLAMSFGAMEQYYQSHGREWERYALIKARQVAGDRAAGSALLKRLQPFVYRRYLDYSTFDSIRSLKGMIESELLRKGIEHNIKLGPGGIREVEFIGQAFQLVRGGRETALRDRSIRKILAVLGRRGDLSPQAVADLDAAYVFLRRSENRLQMADDRQTHVLPEHAPAQLRLAAAMGFRGWDDFHAALQRHMRAVHGYFQEIFAAPGDAGGQDGQDMAEVWLAAADDSAATQRLSDGGFRDPAAVLEILRGFRDSRQLVELSAEGRARMDRLMPQMLHAAGLSADPETTLARVVGLIESIARRPAYLSLLIENPAARMQLVSLCAASAWIAGWISQHPILLDELIDPASLYALPAPAQMRAALQARLAERAADDLEGQMNVLREFHHSLVLRVAAADMGPGLGVEVVSARLADIAECVISEALLLAGASLAVRHGHPVCPGANTVMHPGFAAIAYGKLGSRELGYGSDLDLVFLYEACEDGAMTDGDRPLANEVYFMRLTQRLIHMISTRTSSGIVYPIDVRLRPSGGSGLLVTNLDAYRHYQLDEAWTWEHQALVRARPVAGDEQVCRAFEAVRRDVLCMKRDPASLREEIVAMRTRMRESTTKDAEGRFELKQDPGGMIDIEFMVQYWVLWRAHEVPGLVAYRDNIRLLEALASAGVVAVRDAKVLATAYGRYLSAEHRLKLLERKALVAPSEVGDFPEQVARLWRATMESGPSSGQPRPVVV